MGVGIMTCPGSAPPIYHPPISLPKFCFLYIDRQPPPLHNYLKNLDAMFQFPFIISQNGHIINIQKYANDLQLEQAPKVRLERLALLVEKQRHFGPMVKALKLCRCLLYYKIQEDVKQQWRNIATLSNCSP